MKKLSYIAKVAVLVAAIVALPSALIAGQSIKINVQTQGSGKDNVRAVGFSVNKSRSGSLGTYTNKMGPANAQYSFGIRTKKGGDVSCGKQTLTKNSIVVLNYNGKSCSSKVYPWKSPKF